MERQNKLLTSLKRSSRTDRLTSLFFYFSILLFLIGFNFTDSPPAGGWYQQFMPNLGGRQIVDITFTDSLKGYAITNRLSDTSFIFKTTNSGNNWFFSYSDSGVIYSRIQFINQNTGFVGGYVYKNNSFWLVKTTDAGLSWFYINAPFDIVVNDLFALNEDTIWVVNGGSSTSQGVFLTTNGGLNWTNQLNIGAGNPDRIYMYNARIGFVSRTGSTQLRKTTDGGQTWNLVTGTGTGSFNDMYFIDSLTGWKCKTVGGGGWLMGKTTDGGFNWAEQILPYGGNIIQTQIRTFDNVNSDTIWGVGSAVLLNSQFRGILTYTSNGGNNWLFQLPDTSIHIGEYHYVDFINKRNGWAYTNTYTGIHTTTGGNDTFFTSVTQISSESPKEFVLFQNYPNPFNSNSKIKFQISKLSKILIKVFDITGKQLAILMNEKLTAGEYETSLDATNYSSGIYFYSFIVDGKLIDTKKMILIK